MYKKLMIVIIAFIIALCVQRPLLSSQNEQINAITRTINTRYLKYTEKELLDIISKSNDSLYVEQATEQLILIKERNRLIKNRDIESILLLLNILVIASIIPSMRRKGNDI